MPSKEKINTIAPQNLPKPQRGSKGVKHETVITLKSGESFTREEIRKDPAKVMVSIIKQQRSLYSKGIEDWLHARMQALNPVYPQRWLLYDLYEDILLDTFIHGQIYNHRILPVKNKAYKVFNADKKHNEDKTALLQKGWLDNYITWSLESKFLAHSLIYIKEIVFDGKTSWIKKLELIPRKHVHPEQHIYTIYQTDLQGFDYTKDPLCNYLMPVGEDDDLGLLNKAVPMAIMKKHGWQNWDEFAEIFGMPIRTVKTASQDPHVQAEIEGWLKDMGTAPYGIFPTDTEINVQPSSQSDSFRVFSELIKAANEELAFLFSGQTMTSMNGASKSQGEVHERVMSEISRDDEKFIKILINEKLIPLLRDVHGYPFEEGDYFEWDQPEDKAMLLKIFLGVNQMGFQIDPKQVEEKFGVKIIGLKAPAAPEAIDDEDKPEPNITPGAKDKGKKKSKSQDDELKVSDLVKLHADINKLYAGNHVL